MDLKIKCHSEALEYIKVLSYGMGVEKEGFGLGEDREIIAELIYGKFNFENKDYYNLSWPQDFTLSEDLPYFKVKNIKVIVRNEYIAKKIMSKELVLKSNELNFV